MNIDEDSPTVAPITKPRKATASHSSGRSNSYQRRKASRVFCTVCNDHPDGFRGPHELDRHMLRHDDQKISKTFICRDPASVGIRSDVQAINPLFKCEPCLAQKQYTSLNRAIAHLYLRHIRDPATGKSHTGDSGTPLTEKLKDWCCEVRVGKHGRVVPEAGGTSADTNGGSSDMECDDKEDTVMNSDIPESSSSTQTVDDSSDIHQIICSNCSTQSSLGLYSQSLAEKPLCMDCSNLTTSHGSAQPSYPKAVDLSSTSAAARNPQSSNTENNEHAIREPFSVVTDTVKDSLLFLPAQREWDHVWNRDGPGIEGGYSQTTTTTSATGLHTIGSESTNDTNNIIINEQHSTTAKQEFATRLASIFDRTPAANNTSTTISLTVEGSHSSMDASYYKADPSSYGTANAPIVDCEIAHMGHWDEDQINNLSKK
ncbi:hypothetical protein TrVGV298_008366 [Trichoderma virens]|nr:hypothetical protein TrVGV298_008366 [Trichoderma virens]